MTNKKPTPVQAALHQMREEILFSTMKTLRMVDQYAVELKKTTGVTHSALIDNRSELYNTAVYAAIELESEKSNNEQTILRNAEQYLTERGILEK